MVRAPLMFAIAVCAYTLPAEAQAPTDGNTWRRMDEAQRTYYVAGLVAGALSLAERFDKAADASEAGVALGSDGFFSKLAKFSAQQNADRRGLRLPGRTTVRQIQDGVDDVYRDSANRLIPISDAAWYVIERIGGLPEVDAQRCCCG